MPMYSAAIITAVVLNIQQFLLVTALPAGAWDEACDHLQPGHIPNKQPAGPFPYLVTISNIVDDDYIPGHNYTITLQGTQSTRVFRGFLIQARSTTSNISVGTFWVKPSNHTSKYKPLCTGNTGATHVDNKRKRKVKLNWTAPSAGTGPIRLWYSFVKIHRPIESQSIFWAGVKSNVINEFKNCTVKGQIKLDCAVNERCTYTCDNRNNSIECPYSCVIKGCQCPEGQVVNELTNECVQPEKCPARCPVEGQKRTRCSIPENCTQTCDNKNESIQCPMNCNVFGCQCPTGTVVNTLTNQCVQPDKCPAKCPIAGQVRKICAIPENCTRTCNNLKETITCQETCTPYGCECPNGMVVNHITKECIKPEKCPLDEACPLECSYDNCRRRRRNTRCSIPNDSGFNTSCLDNCNTAFCVANYYSTEIRMPPESCTLCDDPTDMDCLFVWSKCVRRADRVTHDSGTLKKNPENVKYYVHPC